MNDEKREEEPIDNRDAGEGVAQMDMADDDSEEEDEETFEEIANALLEADEKKISEFNFQELRDVVRHMHGVWCCPDHSDVQLCDRNLAFFGPHNMVQQRYKKFLSVTNAFVARAERLTEANLVDEREAGEVEKMLQQVSFNITFGYEMIVQLYRQKFCNNPALFGALPPIRIDALIGQMVEEDAKPHQRLIRFLLEVCNRRCYRKRGDSLFVPHFTENGDFTRTFQRHCSIREFIYDAIYPYEQHKWQFLALTSRSGVLRQCEEHLQFCRSNDLPQLVKDRTKFAFKNGLFDARANRFFPWGEPIEGFGHTVTCANYHDIEFDAKRYEDEMEENGDPLDIATPNVQKMLDTQEFEREVCRWFYASMGRMIFDIGDKDNMQYFPFCKGTAGSGKSTLLKLMAMFYQAIDVGNLMSEGRKEFSIEHLVDKYIFVCYDVDDKMTFSLTRWNQMVSGETIAVERKFKIALQMLWKVPGAFAGNSYPPWVDNAGNVSRRMLIFLFSKMVEVVDTKLFSKCLKEMGAFMKKCVSCYFQVLEEHQDKGIWDQGVLPQYFHENRRKMQAETNPLQAFLSSGECSFGPDEHMELGEFRTQYYAYCEALRLKRKNLTDDWCVSIFQPRGIQIVKPRPNDDPADHYGYTKKYVIGVRVN